MPLQIARYDIRKMCVDAIVNTTNEDMVGYSGLDLAVYTAAGVDLNAECRSLSPLGLGEAKLTGGYGLPCKHVIHTVGPCGEGWPCGSVLGDDAIPREWINTLKRRGDIERMCDRTSIGYAHIITV